MIDVENLTRESLLKIAASVDERHGWDFTHVRDLRDPVPWSYGEVVRHYLTPTTRVLDVGTGGGERFINLASYFGQGVGIDLSPAMVDTARGNLTPTLAAKVSFEVMSADDLRLPAESFDVVLNRHSIVNADQIIRVLKPGGHFITQHVGSRNTANICAAFGCDPGGAYNPRTDQGWDDLQDAFACYGCFIEAEAEYDVPYIFTDLSSFVFWLKAIPMPQDFDMGRHWEQVAQIVAGANTTRGVESNEHRQLMVVRKFV
ncbi:class I SAM-dependent methyltransferase [Chloroflexota bacterium]